MGEGFQIGPQLLLPSAGELDRLRRLERLVHGGGPLRDRTAASRVLVRRRGACKERARCAARRRLTAHHDDSRREPLLRSLLRMGTAGPIAGGTGQRAFFLVRLAAGSLGPTPLRQLLTGGAHSRFPGAVCRQRWTVRLGEVEPVFGQTGRVVLDITARTAHDGALKWTRAPSTPPSREIDLRNIPVHLRTALRRALEFEARAPAAQVGRGSGAVRRAAAVYRGRVLRRPPHPRAATRGALRRGWRRGERPRAPPAPADAERRPGDRQRSHLPGHDGAGHDAVLPRETRPSGEAEAGTLPRLGGAGHLRPLHAEAGLGCKPRGRHAQLAGRSAGAAPLRRHRPGYQDPPLDRLSLRCAGPSGPSRARRAVCWTA